MPQVAQQPAVPLTPQLAAAAQQAQQIGQLQTELPQQAGAVPGPAPMEIQFPEEIQTVMKAQGLPNEAYTWTDEQVSAARRSPGTFPESPVSNDSLPEPSDPFVRLLHTWKVLDLSSTQNPLLHP